MRRFGVNRVMAPGGQTIAPAVVEVEGRRVKAFYALRGEQAFTEWIGGTALLREDSGCLTASMDDGRMLGEDWL